MNGSGMNELVMCWRLRMSGCDFLAVVPAPATEVAVREEARLTHSVRPRAV